MIIPIEVPSFAGGTSRVSPSKRTPIEMEDVDNCDNDLSRGTDKRAGTEHINCDGTTGAMAVVGPTNAMRKFWINRDTDERFVGFIDPDATSALDVIQIWNITTGVEVVVEAKDSADAEVALDDADAEVTAMIAYLRAGTQTPQQRLRVITVEDGTFILNRTVATALEGAEIAYKSSSLSPSYVRNQNNPHNLTAWSDFEQPPVTTAAYPARTTLVAGGFITSDAIWYAGDDDIGLPQGFYWAMSGTTPPWYQRLPTEPASSYVKRDTMPVLLAYDGTKFILQLIDWEPRKSGDGTTNPGPSFIGNAIDDISFHAGRLWFCSGERWVSTRAGDIYNLWINSTSLITDADPIDDSVQGTRVSNIKLLESYRESLIGITSGSRQVELRANGPITPQTYQIITSTDISAALYVEPVRRGSQLYFAGERDAAMLLWEYDHVPGAVSDVARDVTRRVHGYIPAEAHWITGSNAHEQLYMLSLADPDAIYVNTVAYDDAEDKTSRILNSWCRWEYPDATEIVSCEAFDDYLYMVVERDSLLFLERQALGQSPQDTVGSQTLGYSVRVDRKYSVQGVYDADENETVFTLPYLAADSEYQIVTGPAWDTTTIKGAGTDLSALAVVGDAGGFTTLTIPGDVENNADGTDAICYIGVKYSATITLSEPFARNSEGIVQHGNNHLMKMHIRHRDSGGYSVLITPEGRDQITKTFVVPSIGATPLDADQLQLFGEFHLRVMAHARNCTIQLVNDTPFPTTWIDCTFQSTFIPSQSTLR